MSVSNEQKRLVRQRSGNCCEYCLLSQSGQLVSFQIDHIIPVKHDGTDDDDNLCLACYDCNIYKGSDVAALDPLTRAATRLYDPRQQVWDEHFRLNPDATISGLTPEGRTTVRVLRINDIQRVNQRLGEMAVGDYPCKKD